MYRHDIETPRTARRFTFLLALLTGTAATVIGAVILAQSPVTGHPLAGATVTVKVPTPRATVSGQAASPAPTVTVTEIVTGSASGGTLPALGQLGGFLLGVGTMLLGGAAVWTLFRRKDRERSGAALAAAGTTAHSSNADPG